MDNFTAITIILYITRNLKATDKTAGFWDIMYINKLIYILLSWLIFLLLKIQVDWT